MRFICAPALTTVFLLNIMYHSEMELYIATKFYMR